MQFERLQRLDRKLVKSKTCSIALRAENRVKNRYSDVLPYDDTIVKISKFHERVPIRGYINGNYIEPSVKQYADGGGGGGGDFDVNVSMPMPKFDLNELNSRSRHYIATQAPTGNTISEFIDLAVELAESNVDKTCNVVMLTEIKEGTRQKSMDYIDIMSQQLGSTPRVLPSEGVIETREWILPSNGAIIRHYHLRNWIDHSGPPLDSDGTDPLVKLVRKITKGEMLVHCSAGVGRTGTFIALDYILKEGLSLKELFNVVASLKCSRMLMVQTQSQYNYLEKVLSQCKCK